jgi:polyisoprenoid-binding protein YceI
MNIELVLSITTLAFSILAVFVNKASKIVNVALFGLASYLLSIHTDETGKEMIYLTFGLFLISSAVSYFSFAKKPFFRLLWGLVLAFTILLIGNGIVVELFGQKTVVINKFVIAGLGLSIVTFDVGDLKKWVLQKMQWQAPELNGSVESIFIAFVLFLGFFGASYLGVFLVSAVLLIQASSAGKAVNFVLLPISFLLYPVLVQSGSPLLVQADVILGLFIGVGLGKFIHASELLTSGQTRWRLITLFLSITLFVFIGFAGTMFSSMGGPDALFAAMLGLSLTAYISKGSAVVTAVFMIAVSIALYFRVDVPNTETVSDEPKVITDQNGDQEAVKPDFLAFDASLNGRYKLMADSSRVDFDLGEKDITKGAFKKVAGDFKLDFSRNEVDCAIELKMDDFTTFNKFRDESLHGEEYFNSKKHPTMKFVAKKCNKLDDTHFDLIGEFTMLGKTRPLVVSMRRLESRNGTVRLTGQAKLDRTEFGMTPSIAEGNVVRFTYSVLLAK